MTSILKILTKVLSIAFYRINVGFFLLIGTLAFGFMSEVEHLALAQSFVSSSYLLLIPIGVWLFYAVKILLYNIQQLSRPENNILFNLSFLSLPKQALVVSFSFALQLLPAILYGIFLLGTALSLGMFQPLLFICLSLVVLWAAGTAIVMVQLQNPHREKHIYFLKRIFDSQYAKPIIQVYIEWLLRRDPWMLAGSKIFAALLIFAICSLYKTEPYDWRLLAMAMTCAAMANILVLYQIQAFENDHASWIRNLPVTCEKRFVWLIIVLAILVFPETVVLLKHYPSHLPFHLVIINLMYVLSLCAGFFGLLHIKATSLAHFSKKTFAIFIALILLILFKIPLFFITLAILTTGFLLYRKHYYLFEPISN